MSLSRRCTATRACLSVALLLLGRAVCAEPIGLVTELSGPLLVKDASGSIKVLAINSPVEQGEVLATGKGTYAQLSLTDHSSVQLGPDTELAIEKYSFRETTPQSDAAQLSLVRGRVRIATGILGTRDTDSFILRAAAATIDIRRSVLVAEYVMSARAEVAWNGVGSQMRPVSEVTTIGHTTANYRYVRVLSVSGPAALPLELNDSIASSHGPVSTVAAHSSGRLQLAQGPASPVPGARAPGLYVQVLDGIINLSNRGGSQSFSAGQFGFTASLGQPPVVVPKNPGIQFNPPPAFSSSSPITSSAASSAAKSGQVDCEVR
jgi:hypothetical protein